MTPSPTPDPARSTLLSSRRLTAFETTLVVGGIVLFVVLLYLMRDLLNPPLVGGAALILLWPLREHQAVQSLLLAGCGLLVIWFMGNLSLVLVPFAVVYLLAYLFDPVVTMSRSRYGIDRWMTSLLVTVLVCGLVGMGVLLVVPRLLGQLETLGSRLVTVLGDLRHWLTTTPLLDHLDELGVDKQLILNQLTSATQQHVATWTSNLPDAVQGLLLSIGPVFGTLMLVALMPVLFFYMLKDYPTIERSLVGLFPTFGGKRDYLMKAGSLVGNYLRGQLTISLLAALIVTTALMILDVPFALLIGILAGALNMIPSLGILVTNVIAVALALAFGERGIVDVVLVMGVLLAESLFEQAVLTPNILSQKVGLHPVLILFSLFVFGAFLGMLGLLIAVPTTALIVAAYNAYREEMTLDLSVYGALTAAIHRPPTGEPVPSPGAPPAYLERAGVTYDPAGAPREEPAPPRNMEN